MLGVFALANPGVWLRGDIFAAVATTMPQLMILSVALVFVVALGEIDLSFPSIITLGSLVFASAATAGIQPSVAVLLALLAGLGAGLINGLLVAYLGLSSFVTTLGMNFFWAGLINILSNGSGKPLQFMSGSAEFNAFVGTVFGIPVQLFWGLAAAAIGGLLFSKHKFGAYVRFAGDNLEAAAQLAVPVRAIKVASFSYVGLSAGLVGVIVTLVNVNFYPNVGAGLLLPALAGVFVGGTPMFGGVGTIAGAAIGAITISFINVGIITSGLSGFWTDFVYGIVIVLSLGVHRIAERFSFRPRTRRNKREPASVTPAA
jgi:simple sugar transport system permease protein